MTAAARDALFAFGHGHGGIGLGARTGRLIADLAAGRDPGIDMSPYRIDRFQRDSPRDWNGVPGRPKSYL